MNAYPQLFPSALTLPEILNMFEQEGYTSKFLAGDCSHRRYYRLYHPQNENRVLMHAPPPEKVDEFCYLTQRLQAISLSTPIVYERNHDHHYLIIEDFGDHTYSSIFKNLSYDQWKPYYELAIKVLFHIADQCRHQKDWNVSEYTHEKFIYELANFTTWAWPFYKKDTPSEVIVNEFNDLWKEVLFQQASIPKTLVLRDYHIDNIIFLKDRDDHLACGLLDFQDAVWGDITYDIMSLIEDERIALPAPLVNNLWQYYYEFFPCSVKWKDFERNLRIQSSIRHTKNIGIFTKQSLKNGNPSYLKYLPHMWTLLCQSLSADPCLKKIHDWFSTYFPENTSTL